MACGTLSGAPHSGARRQARASVLLTAKPWRKAEFISVAQVQSKGFPQSEALWESNVQNPVYITTVWGYGYKWGF